MRLNSGGGEIVFILATIEVGEKVRKLQLRARLESVGVEFWWTLIAAGAWTAQSAFKAITSLSWDVGIQ